MYPSMPNFIPPNKRTIRAPVNPYDTATIVSVFPKPIDERKCTIQPGFFSIEAGSPTDPKILVVGPSSWWRDVDDEMPLLEIPQSAIQVADSVVRDYCNSVFLSAMGVQQPGLFYVPGSHTLIDIKVKFAKEFQESIDRQIKWYNALLKTADSLWARSNGNPLAIDENMRIAARELGVADKKDWMADFKAEEMVRCNFCGSLKNPNYPICMNCRIADPNHPMSKNLPQQLNLGGANQVSK